jgi:hypothetical protein
MQAQPPASGANERPDGQQDSFCPNCGGVNPGSATICQWCGQPIDRSRAMPNQETPPAMPPPPPWSQMPVGSVGQGPLPGPSQFAPNAGGGCLRAFGRTLAQMFGDAAVESCCGLIGGIVLIAGITGMFLAGRKFARHRHNTGGGGGKGIAK